MYSSSRGISHHAGRSVHSRRLSHFRPFSGLSMISQRNGRRERGVTGELCLEAAVYHKGKAVGAHVCTSIVLYTVVQLNRPAILVELVSSSMSAHTLSVFAQLDRDVMMHHLWTIPGGFWLFFFYRAKWRPSTVLGLCAYPIFPRFEIAIKRRIKIIFLRLRLGTVSVC